MNNPPSPETLESMYEYLFQSTAMSISEIKWPPDAFCFAAMALQRASNYTALVGDQKPALSFKHPKRERAAALEAIGIRWRIRCGVDKPPPKHIEKWLNLIRKNRTVPLSKMRTQKRLLAALLNLLAASDEACFGLGISLTSADNDKFTQMAEFQLLPLENGSSLCRRIHPTRGRVLPKCHTAQTGLTIRSFSNFLALVPSTEVCPEWYSFCADTNKHALNLLLIPWPSQIWPRQFRASQTEKISDEVDRGGYGLFTFDSSERPRIDTLTQILHSAEKTVGKVDGVVFPELALSPQWAERIGRSLVREDRFLITGVGKPASAKACGESSVRLDVLLKGGEYRTVLEQQKHHRWKLEKNQILQYGIGSTLHPEANWWEHIRVSNRRLMLVTLKPWLTVCALLCEDLARPDPLGDLIRSVGPNLVITLLMDGPQLANRWPGRYATTLADDPGCSVLTLTSAGMSRLSNAPPGTQSRSDCVALWKDARTGVPKEITLPIGAAAIVLSIAVEYCEEWTADGRGDGGNAGHPYLVGQYPITVSASL